MWRSSRGSLGGRYTLRSADREPERAADVGRIGWLAGVRAEHQLGARDIVSSYVAPLDLGRVMVGQRIHARGRQGEGAPRAGPCPGPVETLSLSLTELSVSLPEHSITEQQVVELLGVSYSTDPSAATSPTGA
jgi:hypothetical protein